MRKKIYKRHSIFILAESLSVAEISKQLKVSPSYIYRVLRERKNILEECDEDDKWLIQVSLPSIEHYIQLRPFLKEADIAKQFGMSDSTFYRWKLRHNVEQVVKQYYQLFSGDGSRFGSFENLKYSLHHITSVLEVCEPKNDMLPILKQLITIINNSDL